MAGVPHVSLKEALNIRSAGDFDVVLSLIDVHTVEGSEDAVAGEVDAESDGGNNGASSVDVSTGDGQIVDLTAEKDAMIVESTRVDVAFVCGGLEPKVGEYDVDVSFPEGAGFGMTLEGMLYGEDKGTIKENTVASVVPVCIGIVDADKCRRLGGRRVGVGVVGVGGQNNHAETGGKRKEETHAGLFNAGSVGLSHSMEFGGGACGTVTTISGFAGPVSLERICPMLAEYNGVRRGGNGGAVHLLSVHRVQLFTLGSKPEGPGGKLAKLTASELADRLLLGGTKNGGIESVDKEAKGIVGQRM
jgi:hypothetical protein